MFRLLEVHWPVCFPTLPLFPAPQGQLPAQSGTWPDTGSGRFWLLLFPAQWKALYSCSCCRRPSRARFGTPASAGRPRGKLPAGDPGFWSGSLSGGCVKSAPGRPLPSDPAHPPYSPLDCRTQAASFTPCCPGLGEGGAGRLPSLSPLVRPSGTDFIFAKRLGEEDVT